jgi:hypothetical protein
MKAASELFADLMRGYYLTDAQAARVAGVHINTIKGLKAARSQPTPETVRKVAVLFRPDDAARLAEAYGYPGLLDHAPPAPQPVDEAEVLAAVIAETEAALTKLRAVYSKIMQGET